MVAIVKKWRNSLALRIPSALAKDMYLSEGSIVEMTIVDGEDSVKFLFQEYSKALLKTIGIPSRITVALPAGKYPNFRITEEGTRPLPKKRLRRYCWGRKCFLLFVFERVSGGL